MTKLLPQITIIVPVYNADTTLPQLFTTLEKQNHKNLVKEIIFIDDLSPDNSFELIKNYAPTSSYHVKIIRHRQNLGLAKSYNQGIKGTKTKYFILMHDDIILAQTNTFDLILQPFLHQDNLVCSYPQSRFPLTVYHSYNFWQKVLFSRHVGKEVGYFCGKFDCYQRKLLITKVGLFDDQNFRTAGEDGDMIRRIDRAGLFAHCSSVKVIHLHNQNNNFSLYNLFFKEAQIAQAHGAILRRHGPHSFTNFVLVFFRPILIFSLLVPIINIASLSLVVIYSFLYTKLVYQTEYLNPKIIMLPFVNICLLFISTIYSFKGFVTGHETL